MTTPPLVSPDDPNAGAIAAALAGPLEAMELVVAAWTALQDAEDLPTLVARVAGVCGAVRVCRATVDLARLTDPAASAQLDRIAGMVDFLDAHARTMGTLAASAAWGTAASTGPS